MSRRHAGNGEGTGQDPRRGERVGKGKRDEWAAGAATGGMVIPGPTGQRMIVKVSGTASRGAYSLIEYSHSPGAPGPPPHVHRTRRRSSSWRAN